MKRSTSIYNAAAREYLRQIRAAQIRGLSGESLASALDAFERGELRSAAMLWETMVRRDDIISVVKPKREKAVARRDWQILTTDDSAEARRQAAFLEEFWNGVRAVDAFDRNDRGGLAKAIRHAMSCVSFRYAAQHLVWEPTREGLGLTMELVPLSYFENRTGELRFCPTGTEYTGEELTPGEWLITCGDGLMFSGSIGYLCKRNSLADWLAFSDKFGTPGLLAKTNQGKGTPGGDAMLEALETFGSDWSAVLYGDDGSGKIELIQASGASSVLPMPALIERVDKRLTALWRGADLGTLSSQDATGASLQDGETDLIEQDDALTISESFNAIDEMALRWRFGPRVKVKAYFRLIVPQSEDLKLLVQVVDLLVKHGVALGEADILERFGFAAPAAGEKILGKAEGRDENDGSDESDVETRLNAGLSDDDEEVFLRSAGRLLARASVEDRAELVAGMKDVLAAPDGKLVERANAFLEALPEQVGKDRSQVRAWESLIATSLVNGFAADEPAE